MTQGTIPGEPTLRPTRLDHPDQERRSGRAGRLALALLLLTGVATGCGNSSTPTSNPTSGTGTIRLVPPVACGGSACAGTTINDIQITGPTTPTTFSLFFGVPTNLPFALAGAYTETNASFTDSNTILQGCPGAGFTVAVGLTTTVTFSVNNNVCTVAVSGPA